jgi:type IV pilus biogenesis protein CpaD/CtpE
MSLSQRAVFHVSLALTAASLLGLAACSNGGSSADESSAAASETQSAAAGEPTASEPAAPLPQDESGAAPPGSGIATGKPFVVILFPDGNTDYETELAAAIRKAQERKPGFALDLAAVSPTSGSPEELQDNSRQALARADEVIQSLSALGVGRDRINLVTYSAQESSSIEIRLYIR